MTSSTSTNGYYTCKFSRHSKDLHSNNEKGNLGQAHVSRSCCAR